jgi:hypothetical protein
MSHPLAERYFEAYIEMAPFYRPHAPGDGIGNIHLTAEQCRERDRLFREAAHYAARFIAEEDTLSFWIWHQPLRNQQGFHVDDRSRALPL